MLDLLIFWASVCLPAFAAYWVLLIFMGMILPGRLKHWWQCALVAFGISLFNLPKALCGMYSLSADVFRLLSVPVLLLLVPILCFEGPIWRRLLINLLLFGVQAMSDMLSLFLLHDPDWVRNNNGVFDSPEAVFFYTAVAIMLNIVLDSVIVLLARTLQARRFSGIYLPILLILISLAGTHYAYISSAGGLFWCVTALLGALSVVLLMYYVISLEKKTALEQELQDVHYTMELEQAHYRAVEERREELARIRHDFNNQLATISLLIQAGEQKDAEAMLHQLGEGIAATQENAYCAIPVVNAVLAEKAAQCAKAGIRLETELNLPWELAVEPLHLCSIFANLLDNAIHGCAGQKEPVITLVSHMAGDYLFLRTVNPAAPPQAPAPGHGYGSRILKELAARYDGSYETTYKADKNGQNCGSFVAQVTLLAKN